MRTYNQHYIHTKPFLSIKTMATLSFYRKKVRYLSNDEAKQQQWEIFQAINRHAFFPLKAWPRDTMRIFYKQPPGNTDSFKLLLFRLGNSSSPHLTCPWILLASQIWAPEKAVKRAQQIDFVVNNLGNKCQLWFYFDVDYGKMLFSESQMIELPNCCTTDNGKTTAEKPKQKTKK